MTDEDGVATGLCPHCGSPTEALTGLGMIVMCSPNDVESIVGLFAGLFDDLPCGTCGRPMGTSATVTFVDRPGLRMLTFLGTRMAPQSDDAWLHFELAAKQLGERVEAERCTSLDTLRDAARAPLREAMNPLIDALKAHGSERLERAISLEPLAFVAAEIGRRIPQSGLGLGGKDTQDKPIEADAVYRSVAILQAATLIEIFDRWMRDASHPRPFGETLARYLPKGGVLPDSPTLALALLGEQSKGRTFSLRGQYLCEAFRAVIHAAAGTPNPEARLFALHFYQLEVQRVLGDEQGRADANTLALNREQAAATVDRAAAWDAIQTVLQRSSPGEHARLVQVLTDISACAGHPDLMDQLFAEGIRVEDPEPSAERLVEMASLLWTKLPSGAGAADRAATAALVGGSLQRAGRLDDIERAIDRLVVSADNDDALRARLLAWFGECCKEQRKPKRFIDRVGDQPQAWESAVDAVARAMLWTERSNALRILGRVRDAKVASEMVLPLLPSLPPKDGRVARLNHAILLRDTDDVEGAARELETLLEETLGTERIGPLESLALAYQKLDRSADAAACYEEVLSLSRGPRADHAPRARAAVAMARVVAGQYDAAVRMILALDGLERLDPFLLFPVASSWVTLLANGVELPDPAYDAIGECLQHLHALAVKAIDDQDTSAALQALRLQGLLCDQVESPDAVRIWTLVLDLAEHAGQEPEVHELLALARAAYEAGDVSRGRSLLLRLPSALAAINAVVTEVGRVSIALRRATKRSFDRLTHAVLEHGQSFDDVRLVNEMRRDVVGRARRVGRGSLADAEQVSLLRGLEAGVLRSLAPPSGRLAVHEWIETAEYIASFVTVIDADGSIDAHWLEVTDVGLDSLAVKMRDRLRDWSSERPGDPLDLPDWHECERWIVASLEPLLGDDAHVVFIEHDDYAGLPWHVAVATCWTASFAAGWGSLLALSGSAPSPVRRFGIAAVPRFREELEVVAAFDACTRRMTDAVRSYGVAATAIEGVACDAEALGALMSESDAVLLLCHGFAQLDDQEVALMVAYDGALPPAHAVAVGEARGHAHRFGWRQALAVERAPAMVFSAACSSNVSHVVGLGERLGLFGGLRHAGTRSVAAPRWHVVAEVFVPIVERVVELHLFGGATLADAVRDSCLLAQNTHPRWMCWALSIEGDWR